MRDPRPKILVVRLGAMGDVIHTLPAVSTLKASFPESSITWAVDPKWTPLLEGNPSVDRVVEFNRRDASSIHSAVKALRATPFDFAIDFQGLIKSALLASVSGCRRRLGFHWKDIREKPAALLYTEKIHTFESHVAEKNIELAQAAGAATIDRASPLPDGVIEGSLPEGPYVLACPLAGWTSKQWPLEYFSDLAARIAPLPLVVNGAPVNEPDLRRVRGAWVSTSGISGLIGVTRRAVAVVGVDSGPLQIAGALSKPGVAIFGPTDPTRNGPLGTSIEVLRAVGFETTYKRGHTIAESMRAVTPEMVAAALLARIPH
jgi:heptosyltransferase-1